MSDGERPRGSSATTRVFTLDGTEQVTGLLERPRRSKSAPVGVVGKVISILERLDQAPGGVLLREIVNSTSINKSSAYRLQMA